MKKGKIILLAFVMLLMLTACNNDKSDNSSIASGAGDLSGLASDVESGLESDASKIESGLESGASRIESGMDSIGDEVNSAASKVKDDVDRAVGNMSDLSATKQGWGQGHNKNDKNQPTGSLDFQSKYGKYDAFFISPKEDNKIYLTFDEGYENGYTAQILDTLKEKKVSAVFFITYDYANRNPDLVKRMIDEGHIVGNHSYGHICYPDVSVEEAKSDLMKMHQYIKDTFQYEMKLFRFPSGEFSEQTLAMVQECGYKSLFWSFAYQDWDAENSIGTEQAYQKICENAHQGAIYLLHAVSKDNAAVLGDVIDTLRSDGYTLAKFDL